MGPLGNPSDFVREDLEELKNKSYLFVAGGVGTAPVYPQVKWFHEHGMKADVIVGAKTKDLVILEEDMKAVAGNLYVTTDDGSYGRKGMVTETIKDLVEKEGKALRRVRGHRPHDHDEVCLPADQGAEHPHHREHEPHHGGRNRHVRRLPSDRGRQGEIRLCGRPGILTDTR